MATEGETMVVRAGRAWLCSHLLCFHEHHFETFLTCCFLAGGILHSKQENNAFKI